MASDDHRFFEELDIFNKPSKYVSAKFLRQNVLTTIYMTFFTLVIEFFYFLFKFAYHLDTIPFGTTPIHYIHIYLIFICIFIQIYLRKIKKTLIERRKSAVFCMFLYGFSFLGCNLIFSLGEIRQNQFPGSFFVAAVFYFAIVIIEPLFLFFSTIFSFSTMFFISMPNFDSLNIINCLVLVVVLVLVGFVHYSISLHRYSTEESLSEANSVLIQMSIYDHLTKLKNRNAWRQDFDNMLGKKCYMMICDIDDFKRFNDTFGHAAGDRVLKTVADCLVDVFGKECCYRFGGDEFIVLTAEPIDDFAFLFQKFEDKLWNSEIEDVDIHPTMSGGCVYGICYDHEAIRRMMQYADEALYRAKDNGKNKLVIDMMYEKKLEKKAVAH